MATNNNSFVGVGKLDPEARLDVNGSALFSENVGIGLLNPSEKLEVSGNIKVSSLSGNGNRVVVADAFGLLTTQALTGNENTHWSTTGNNGTNPSNNFIGTTDAKDLVIKTNGEEQIRILGTGTHPGIVGFGISNPEKALHIRTHHEFILESPNPNCLGPFPPIGCAQQSNGGGSAGSHNGIRLEDNTDFSIGSSIVSSIQSKWDLVPAYGSFIIGKADLTASNFDGLIGTQPMVMVDPTGNMGIGANPIQKLDVNGRMNLREGVIQRGGDPITNTTDLGLYSREQGYWMRFVTNQSPIRFFSDANVDPKGTNANMTIESNGRVGIGTDAPNTTLDVRGTGFFSSNVSVGTKITNADLFVHGTVNACEVIVEKSLWCDYVFADNYSLMPLHKVEQYLKEYKHLPKIPSASEIEKNGINLGEMNKLMMEKIEEMTLYIIAQEKRISELEEITKKQNKQ